jgi:NADH:ubiquinone oxidoreductase subunit 5 (subunit L)/multisubunit Na+/H+ antiporter MnhA subunit
MYVPYLLLALVTIAIGVVGPLIEQGLASFLEEGFTLVGPGPGTVRVPELHYLSPEIAAAITTALVLGAGGAIGYNMYISKRIDASTILKNPLLNAMYNFLWNRLYVNAAYYVGFARGTLALSGSVGRWVESGFFDRISGAVSGLSVGLSSGGDRFDLQVVDGAVNGVATTGRYFSRAVAKLQTGVAQQYLLAFALGLFLVVVAMVFLGM